MSPPWDDVFTTIESTLEHRPAPSVNIIESHRSDPWDVLVSTIISLRTRDNVTLKSSLRLLELAPDAQTLSIMEEKHVARLIYPAGFYKTKAANLKKIADIIIAKHGAKVPQKQSELLNLPGVGLKTANLVLGVGFGIPAICVDIHVHRIANRCGWIHTSTPEQSESALVQILPKKWWIPVNRILVGFGQNYCTPLSPKCSFCPIFTHCKHIGVLQCR